MQQPQVLVYGIEGRLAEQLHELGEQRRLWIREVKHLKACRSLLRTARPAVLVIRLGRDVEKELALLSHVHDLFPETATVVLGDADNAALAGLAWDLGASYVLLPPMPAEALPGIIVTILSSQDSPPAS